MEGGGGRLWWRRCETDKMGSRGVEGLLWACALGHRVGSGWHGLVLVGRQGRARGGAGGAEE